MKFHRLSTIGLIALWLIQPFGAGLIWGQDPRAQYPGLLENSYVGLQIGYIDYRFSNSQLRPGLNAGSILVPHLSVRALLFGHEFNKYLSAQISYLRPVEWVRYENVNGDEVSHSVWMNMAGLTAKPRLPLTETISVYGEGGLGLVTRKGFEVGAVQAVDDAVYATILMGAGIQYRVNRNWDLLLGVSRFPAHAAANQPSTSVVSAGFNYAMRRLSAEQVERNSDAAFPFPKNVVQVGYTTNAFGYGVNDFVSTGPVPIFWAADVRLARGLTVNYDRNVFHTRRVFALDWGGGLSLLKSQKDGEALTVASLYPVLRFSTLRSKPLDLYLDYSLAGPSFISRTIVDGYDTGHRFTFQDFMGAGVFFGARRHFNAEVRIAHYSNGNLFPHNPGITVPLAFNIGYAF